MKKILSELFDRDTVLLIVGLACLILLVYLGVTK